MSNTLSKSVNQMNDVLAKCMQILYRLFAVYSIYY